MSEEILKAVELVERIKQMKVERKRYFDVEGDGVDALLDDMWDFLESSRTPSSPTKEMVEAEPITAEMIKAGMEACQTRTIPGNLGAIYTAMRQAALSAISGVGEQPAA